MGANPNDAVASPTDDGQDHDRKAADSRRDGGESAVSVAAPKGRRPWRRSWWSRKRIIAAIVALAVLFVAFVVLLTLGLLGYYKPQFKPEINLDYATYVGTRIANGNVDRYAGMRYAAAPIGDLRWRAPVDPPVSNDTQSAENFGPICYGIGAHYNQDGQSDDCLFVNVYKPARTDADSKLPVWVFIQGGGYITNSNANWDGSDVIRSSNDSLVFVNFNYRVGLWGFLASQRLAEDGDLNVGLLDQRFLLRWVQKHISAFGGDPDDVTIHGTSAGAGSVALHLTAYGGRNDGLFHAAIGESIFMPAQPFVADLEYQFDRLATAVNCPKSSNSESANTTQLACIRGKSTQELQAANVASPFPGRTSPPVLPLFYWTPCVDGNFTQDLPMKLIAQGKVAKDIPLLFGNDNNEGSLFAPKNAASEADMALFMQDNYPLLTANDTINMANLYPVNVTPPVPQYSSWFPSVAMMYGEATFICPAINLLNAYAKTAGDAGSKMWSYRYNVADADDTAQGLGTIHLFESWAVFGPGNLGGSTPPSSYYSYNAPMVPLVMDYWISFVVTKDPNISKLPGAPEWQSWDTVTEASNGSSTSRLVFELDNTRMEAVPSAQVAKCDFWQDLTPRTQQK